MHRLALALFLLAAPVTAQTPDCPADAHAKVEAATRTVEAGEGTVAELGPLATALVRSCSGDRALYGHILAMFTRAGLAVDPPDRFAAHQNAVKTMGAILKLGGWAFEDVGYEIADGAPQSFTALDERNAYFDLMLAMSTDYLVFSVHDALYGFGTAETIGCGLYPAEEAAALAAQGAGNADGGELVARVGFLGRRCDGDGGETAGQVARYFAAHYHARAADPGYLGLTSGDIRAGLQRFLPAHLGGAAESPLFSAAEVAELLAF